MRAKENHSVGVTVEHLLPRQLPSARLSLEDVSLEVIRGPHEGMRVSLEREVMWIGRGDWCDIALNRDLQVSKEHCELQLTEKGIKVLDHGSRNGVFLSGVPVIEAYWQLGSVLSVGESEFQLISHEREKDLEFSCYDKSQLLVGQSFSMRKLFSHIARLADKEFPLMILGETGVGKTTIARAIHEQSERHHGPFVEVNCGSIAPTLLESLFFGYEKGAFTGASKRHRGFFEQAQGGTLFLDEIAELPLEMQPKFLRILESGRLQRLGSELELEVDFRLLSASHQPMLGRVKQKQFREDLYYRIAVVELNVPPLRERLDDLPLLIDWLLRDENGDMDILLTGDAIQKLQAHLWPGNVRELRNVLLRTIALAEPALTGKTELTISSDDIALYLEGDLLEGDWGDDMSTPSAQEYASTLGEEELLLSNSSESPGVESVDMPLKEYLQEVERNRIFETLERHDWKMNKTAEVLDISRIWLYKLIKKHKLKERRKG